MIDIVDNLSNLNYLIDYVLFNLEINCVDFSMRLYDFLKFYQGLDFRGCVSYLVCWCFKELLLGYLVLLDYDIMYY